MATINLGKIKPLYKGVYSTGVTYRPLDFVLYNSGLYVCKQQATGVTPTDPAYFDPLTPAVASLVGLTGAITQAQVNTTVAPGLPVSTATQTALNGKLDKTGGTLTNPLYIVASAAMLGINRTDPAQTAQTGYSSAGVMRWGTGIDGGAYGNYFISRYNDAGAYVDTPVAVDRGDGSVRIAGTTVRSGTTLPAWAATITVPVSGSSYIEGYGATGRPVIQTERAPGDSAIWWLRHAAVGAGYTAAIGCYGNVGVGSGIRLQLPSTFYDFAASGAYKMGGGSWSDTSDERTKQNIEPWAVGLSAIMQLKVRRWNFRKETGRDVEQEFVGLVAQEAEEVAPRLVSKRKGELGAMKFDDLRSVDPSDLVYMLVNSVQEQQRTIEQLQARITVLEAA